jgi:acetyltransferase-like isoleucine patch superfamily enzyme
MAFDLGRLKQCGVDVRIAPSVVISYPELVSIGDHVAIDDFTYITTSLDLGSYIHIGPHCSIIGGKAGHCLMEDFSGLAAGCRLVCVSGDFFGSGLLHPFVPPACRGELHGAPITFRKYAILGTGCIVHPGVTLGEGAAVGSASLVVKSLDPWSVYFGVPARYYRERDKVRILECEKEVRSGDVSHDPGRHPAAGDLAGADF